MGKSALLEYDHSIADDQTITLHRYHGSTPFVKVPSSLNGCPVTKLDEGIFQNCREIKRIFIPNEIIEIGPRAFENCVQVQEIRLSNALTGLQPDLFLGCKSLEQINIPNEVMTLPNRLLKDTAIRQLTIGKNVSEIQPRSINCKTLRTITIDQENPFFSTDGVALFNKERTVLLQVLISVTEYQVPEGIVEIASNAFENSSNINKVMFPNSLKKIGEAAFYSTSLLSLKLPDSVEIIEDYAFKYCPKLISAELSGNLISIGKEAFYDTGLQSIFLPKNVSTIGKNAFHIINSSHDSRGIHSLGVDSENPWYFIDENGLYHKNEQEVSFVILTNYANPLIIIADGTTQIEDHAFSFYPEIKQVQLPGSMRKIGSYAFYSSGLKKINLPEGLESIGEFAFFESKVEELAFPSSLTKIGPFALLTETSGPQGRRLLRAIVVAPDNPVFLADESALYLRTSSREYSLEIYFGDSPIFLVPLHVTEVKENAFSKTPLEEIYIHKNVKKIHKDAFSHCGNLNRIIIELQEPEPTYSQITIYIPISSAIFDDVNPFIDCITMFQGEEIFDFAKYDSYFNTIREKKHKMKIAMDRMRTPFKLQAQYHKQYADYLKTDMRYCLQQTIASGDLPSLMVLNQVEPFTSDTIDQVIQMVSEAEKPEIIGYLLEYKHAYFGASFLDYEL